MAVKKNIPPLDLLFYLMETHDSPKHVAGLQVFRMPADAGDNYLIELVDKLRQVPAMEPFNCRPVFGRTHLPQWHSVDDMDMDYHLRHSALPKPGSTEQLMSLVQRLHCRVLDRDRPGWLCYVIEGLQGNRFAIYSKVHHAYIDGMSGVRRLYGCLSSDPKDRDLVTLWGAQRQAADADKPARRVRDRPSAGIGAAALSQARAIGQVNVQLVKMAMELAGLGPHTGNIPFQAPRTRINDPVHSDLRSIGVTTLPLDRMKKIGKRAGCTVNDVVLAVTDAALHDYLVRHDNDPAEPLVAMCPMSLRRADDDTPNTQVFTLMIELGRPGVGLRERLRQVARSATSAKEQAREMSKDALIDFVLIMAGVMELLERTGLDRVIPQSFNVLVSNVPGPGTGDLYLMGSRMEASYPISTLTPGNNLNLTVLSHGNSLDFGLLAAHGTLPDIDYLVKRLVHQFDALAREYGVNGASGRKTPVRKKAARSKKKKTKAKAGPASRGSGA